MIPQVANDPWWIALLKLLFVFVVVLTWTIMTIWVERRGLGRMQNRKGPNMVGPFGLLQTFTEAFKLIFKEDFRPARTDAVVFNLAPLIAGICAFATWSVIPFAGEVNMFGHHTYLQAADSPIGVLVIIAISGIAIYGVVLAGWASNGAYSLLGTMRAAAQLISYEVAMGLSLVAVFIYAGSMSTHDIVEAQGRQLNLFGWQVPGLSGWYWALLLPSFLTYIISGFGESNRQPFDFAECETELVSGHITDYSGFRYGSYYLAEYINLQLASSVATTLFLGGYLAPWQGTFMNTGWWGLFWFLLKAELVVWFFIWTRGAIPRYRYDKFMDLGWKILIPGNLCWLLLIAVVRGGGGAGWFSSPIFYGVAIVIVLGLLAWAFLSGRGQPAEPEHEPAVFDAFAGGYPVPPMPGQQIPELVGVVAGSATEPAPARSAKEVDA